MARKYILFEHVQLFRSNRTRLVVAALVDRPALIIFAPFGELCGVDDAGLPSFARTQAATDGERGGHLVYYAFDLLHVDGWDISNLELLKRKELLEPSSQTNRAFSSTVTTQATASSS